MKSSALNSYIQRWLLAIFMLFSFLTINAQEAQTSKELDEAINNAKNSKFEQAIPVLKKYAEMRGLDDYKTLEINIYLNWCYLATKNGALDVVNINQHADYYLAKYSISKSNSLRGKDEMGLLFFAGLLNLSVGKNEKVVLYLSLIKKNYEEKQLEKDQFYSIVLSRLSQGFYNLSDYKSAIEVGQIAWKVNSELFGEKNETSLNILDLLFSSYKDMGVAEKSLMYIQQRVVIGKEVLGENHPDYLMSLNNLVSVYSDISDYPKALEINLKIIKLRKEILGERHSDYLVSLSNLAIIYSYLGDYPKALEACLKVVELRKEVLGEKHPDYFASLGTLAVVYLQLGDYPKALEVNLKVAELEKEALGEKNLGYLTSLNNLATIYSYLGDYPKALETSLKVVKLRKAVLGEKHPAYLTSLNNLSYAYSGLGDYQKALEINLKVVELEKQVLGEKNRAYLTSLSNLAQCYSESGNYKKSLEINLKVIEIRKSVLGEKHPSYLTSLNNLAMVYSHLGEYKQALEINLRVAEINKEVLGEQHPNYLTNLNNIASVYSRLGDYPKAFEIDLKVVESVKKVLGEKHPNFILGLKNLAISESHLSETISALSHYRQMLSIIQERVIGYFSLLTEHDRELFWNRYRGDFTIFPMFFEKAALSHREGGNDAYNISLFSKGILLNTNIDFDKLIAEKGTSEAIAKFEELKLLKLQIQRLQEKPIAQRYLKVDSLQDIAQKKETDLVKLSKEYGDYTRNLKINWKDVQANLQDKDVAIEFVEYPTLADTVKYAALVLRKGWQYPKMISLFRKDQIEEFIKQDKDKIYSNGFVGKQIKKLIWEPLEQVISPGDRVYFSPAGIIHQLSIENLSSNDSLTLGDNYEMHRLSSTKDLVLHKPEEKNTTAVLYGGLQYDLSTDTMIVESKKYEKKENLYAMRGFRNDTTVRSGWKFLAGTKPEVDQINKLMNEKHYQVTEYTGETGNEESFKALSGKKEGIIHIATHGFFLPIEESRKNLFMLQRMGDQKEGPGVDPMLRSGLMLSGGNRAWQGEKIPETIEDGVLTAKEISHLDLRGTDLVVLSACETGLGDVSSEGVFGLQRSFKQAGVQTLIMSLWEVNDQATRYMMTEFYSNLLSGKDKRSAFLEAKRKCKKKFTEPQYWAAFIMLD